MYKISDAKIEDIAQIAEIEKLCFSLPWTVEQLKTQLGERYVFLVASENDEVLGYVGLMTVLDEGYISNVAVSPNHRRRSIADTLIEKLCSRAQELAFITLEVRESNVPAIKLYEKHGFKNVATRKNYYDKPKENAIIMTRESLLLSF